MDAHNQVFDTICDYFGITREELQGHKGTYLCHSTARQFAWYILHYDYKYTINQIATLFSRTPNGIKKGCAKMRSALKYQPYYQDLYKDLTKQP